MSLFSPLFVICLDENEAPVLTALARALGYPDAHVVSGTMRDASQALAARTSSPEYIIIDIGVQAHEILPMLDDFAQSCEPNVRVVVIGGINDITFYRELRARGVLEYFARPVQPSDIRQVLLQAAAAPAPVAATPATPKGKVISCMSAASGDGSTTVALNLAYALAQEYRQPTVLVDMDYQFGLISKSLDLAAPFGIREIFDHPERGLDDVLISKMLVKYKDNLSIVASPGELRLLPVIRPEVIRELVALLRAQFAFVVIDVPHVWTDWTAAALTYSDHAVMVAELWLRSLTHASRLLTAWHTVGVDRDAVSLVINRSGAKFKEAITAQDFERICHQKIMAYFNNDVKAVTMAENHARTLFEIDSNTLLKPQIRQFAESLIVRYLGANALRQAAPTPQAPSSQAKLPFFTKIGKK